MNKYKNNKDGGIFKTIAVIFLLLISCTAIQAEGIQAILGKDSVRFTYNTEAWGQEIGNLDVEAGVLVTGQDYTLLHLGALVQHQSIDSSLRLSIGGRAYYSSIANKNAVLLALGGSLLLSPSSWSGIGLGISYFTAPSMTNFVDAESFIEYSFSINYQITPQANLALGFQSISIDLAGEYLTRDLEKGSFLGLQVEF